jgi:chromosomal replication initiator protein
MNRISPPPFLLLPENRFAHAALLGDRIANEGTPAHTVFLYGPSGVGKSMLVELARVQYRVRNPRARTQQWTASQFAAEFAEASSGRTIPLFQSATRQVDWLAIEDLHALEGRPETQTQLLSLCDELHVAGCTIVWSSRKSPGELTGFSRKLISRFRGGVLAPVHLPRPSSRRLLIEHFSKAGRISFAGKSLDLLADGLAASPRELAAAVTRLAALARLDRSPIDSDLVRKFLIHDLAPPPLKLEDICRAVARQFGTSAGDLRSRKRARVWALPRQCAMFLARELTPGSLEQIGRFFGGRDHSTVIHSCQRFENLLEQDPDLRSQLNQVRHMLGSVAVGELCE